MNDRRDLRGLIGLLAVSALLAGTLALAEPPAAKPTARKLLVVAPRRWHSVLAGFVRYKQSLLPTELVALEEVLKTSPGADDPERLKRFLYQRWREDHVGYALLVGDCEVMPVRYMVLDRNTPAAHDFAFYPSDLYYSDLAKQDGRFDDWNARKDSFHAGYFGEVRGEHNKNDPINYDEIDYRPEIAVGRWPVSNKEEVRLIADKTMRYEKGVLSGKKPGLRRAALFNVGGWVDGRGQMNRWAADLPAGWKAEKRYYADAGRPPATPPPDQMQLLTLLNQGIGLVLHVGHGSDDTWEGCFAARDLSRVKNADRLPIMMSAGCSTAHFAPLAPYAAYVDVHGAVHAGTDHGEIFHDPPPPPAPYQKGRLHPPSSLGELLLRYNSAGAVAYIGCNTGGQPCALTLLEGFVMTLSKARDPRLGDCWAGAISYYYDKEHLATLKPNNDWYPPSIFFQGMKYMVFGDPSLRLPGPEK